MARLFSKPKQEEIEKEFEEYENSEAQREVKRGRPPAQRDVERELPPLPQQPLHQVRSKEVIVEREVTLSLLNEKLNYIISFLEKAMEDERRD